MAIDFDSLVLGPCIGAFGIQVVYMPGGGGAVPMSGVFDEAFTEIKYQGESPVATERPMLGVRASAFPGLLPCRGELFQINGAYWAVIEPPHADGHGHLKIFLMPADEQGAP